MSLEEKNIYNNSSESRRTVRHSDRSRRFPKAGRKGLKRVSNSGYLATIQQLTYTLLSLSPLSRIFHLNFA